MFVVLTDDKNRYNLSESNSLLNLPFFSEKFFNRLIKNISRIAPGKIVIYSKNDVKNLVSGDIELIENESQLTSYLLSTPEEYTVVFSSSVFVDIDEEFISILDKNTGEYSIYSEEKQLICSVFSNKNMAKNLSGNFFEINKKDSECKKQIVYKGYSKNVEKPLDYKAFLDDVLQQKTSIFLPEIAQGIFTEDEIPEGHFVIIPPVYFDIGVQIEDGAVIGPGAIIMRHTLISKKSEIRNSIICEGSYVSSNCLVEKSLLYENVNIRRNSVIMGSSVLGHNSTIGEETIIENNSVILPFTKVDELKSNYVNFKKETNESPAGFYGYLPEKAALLGAAVGKVFNMPRIAVASDGEKNSTALKFALLSGLITTGATCFDFGNTFLSSLHYFMEFCELDCAIFVSGNRSGTVITVFKKKSYSLTSSQYYNIKALMVSGQIERCSFDECRTVNQIHGMPRMYIQNLIKDFSSPLEFEPLFKCYNKKLLNVVEIATAKVGYKKGENRYKLNLNTDGTKISVEYDNVIYPDSKIREIVSFFNKKKDSSRLWEFDGVILCFELLRILNEKKTSIKEILKNLPEFYIVEDYLNYNGSLHQLINKIAEKDNVQYKSGNIHIERSGNKVLVNKFDEGVRVIAKASSSEAAREIVGDIISFISSL